MSDGGCGDRMTVGVMAIRSTLLQSCFLLFLVFSLSFYVIEFLCHLVFFICVIKTAFQISFSSFPFLCFCLIHNETFIYFRFSRSVIASNISIGIATK